MKTHKSTVNGGKTVILDSLGDAIKVGEALCEKMVQTWSDVDPKTKLKVSYVRRDAEAKKKGSTMNAETLVEKWQHTSRQFTECVDAIMRGSDAQKEYITSLADRIRSMAHVIEPSLTFKPGGFCRGEEGFEASPEALASNDDRPFIRRSNRSEDMTEKAGGECYRIIINTDVPWWGKQDDNAGVMGALVLCLQQYGPVEVWVQQGWLAGGVDDDGVTLFKLDFNGAFDPTQLAFWCGHHMKDAVFSYVISRGLGRKGGGTSTEPEVECSLYLHGCWMKQAGISEATYAYMKPEEQQRIMAEWVSKTSLGILGRPSNN